MVPNVEIRMGKRNVIGDLAIQAQRWYQQESYKRAHRNRLSAGKVRNEIERSPQVYKLFRTPPNAQPVEEFITDIVQLHAGERLQSAFVARSCCSRDPEFIDNLLGTFSAPKGENNSITQLGIETRMESVDT